jgi:hypothetical protein
MAGRQMTAWIAGLSFVSANLGSLEMTGTPRLYIDRGSSSPTPIGLRRSRPLRARPAISLADSIPHGVDGAMGVGSRRGHHPSHHLQIVRASQRSAVNSRPLLSCLSKEPLL